MTYFLSLAGSAVLIGCAVQSLRGLTATKRLAWLPSASMLLSLIPLGELSVGRWIHSFTGFLSLPAIILLAWYSIKPLSFQNLSDRKLLHHYRWLVVILGCLYFPASMGLGDFDPHTLGWQPSFVWIPISLSIVMSGLGQYWLAAIFATAVLAWQWRWLGTGNGWSYLIDPIAMGISAFGLANSALSTFRVRRISSEPLSLDTPPHQISAHSTAASKAA